MAGAAETWSMRIKVLFFATFREYAGLQQAELELPDGAQVKDLRARLGSQYPALALHIPSALIAINHEFAFDDDLLPDGAEAAVFPRVSGGSADLQPEIFAVTEQALDLDQLLAQISLPASGAACIFTGLVRGLTTRDDPHETVYLEYEAYRPMAEAKMKQVAGEIRQRWPAVQGIAIVQRLGRLYPQTPTVIIACTAAHRDTGVFEAARYGIDRLKEIVPVWKKEVGPQGEEWIEGEYTPGHED
jgi:molybdopterin synthase catalytic subunit/molybdopterin converting factor small subunit